MHLTDWSPGSMSTSIKADVLEQVLRKRRNLPGKFTPQPQRPQAKQIFIWHYSHTFDCWSIYTVCDHPRNQHMVCTDVRLGCTEPVLWGCSAELTCSALISFQFLTLSTDLGGFGREALDNEHEKKSGVVKLKFLIRSQLLNLVLPGASSESVPTSLSLSLSSPRCSAACLLKILQFSSLFSLCQISLEPLQSQYTLSASFSLLHLFLPLYFSFSLQTHINWAPLLCSLQKSL